MEGSNNANKSKQRATEVKENIQKAIEETQKIYAEKQTKMLKAIENGKVVDSIKVMADTIRKYIRADESSCIKCCNRGSKSRGKGFRW